MMTGALMSNSSACAGCPILRVSEGWEIANRRTGVTILVVEGQPPTNGRGAKCDVSGAPAVPGLGGIDPLRGANYQLSRHPCPFLSWGTTPVRKSPFLTIINQFMEPSRARGRFI